MQTTPTDEAILVAWKALKANPLKCPYATEAEVEQGLALWRSTLRDVDDEGLMVAVQAHLASERCRFWPKPGELLRLVPRCPRRPLALEDSGYADRPWGRLQRQHPQLAVELFDQAVADTAYCQRCERIVPCDDCARAIERRSDELALIALQGAG